jgi:hypothetical protein
MERRALAAKAFRAAITVARNANSPLATSMGMPKEIASRAEILSLSLMSRICCRYDPQSGRQRVTRIEARQPLASPR